MRGVPLRLECGPRDLENGQCVLVRRNDGVKTVVNVADSTDVNVRFVSFKGFFSHIFMFLKYYIQQKQSRW